MAARHLYKDVSSWRRGPGRVAFFLSFVLLLAALGGCGGSDDSAATDGAPTEAEKASDVALLNSSLAQELTRLDAYTHGWSQLRGQTLALTKQLHEQNQAHDDALLKVVRNLGAKAEATAPPLKDSTPADRTAALQLAYEEENEALALAMDVAPQLYTAAPRTLVAALAASHAQHLTVLRQALGATPAASVPEPFESGEIPAPGETDEAEASQ
jgi:Ferritin-like domain